jgi:hypothetical protein
MMNKKFFRSRISVQLMRKAATIMFAAMLLFGTMNAKACPMCQGGYGYSKKSVKAYKTITAVLAVLPIGMGAGIFWWIRKQRAERIN